MRDDCVRLSQFAPPSAWRAQGRTLSSGRFIGRPTFRVPYFKTAQSVHRAGFPLSSERPMNAAAFLLLCSIAPQRSDGLDNLDFASGKMTGWEGEGFYITTASGAGPG